MLFTISKIFTFARNEKILRVEIFRKADCTGINRKLFDVTVFLQCHELFGLIPKNQIETIIFLNQKLKKYVILICFNCLFMTF